MIKRVGQNKTMAPTSHIETRIGVFALKHYVYPQTFPDIHGTPYTEPIRS